MTEASMSNQSGFCFADDAAPVLQESPPGTWTNPRHTADQYQAMLAVAVPLSASIPVEARALFACGIEAATAALAAQQELHFHEAGDGFSLCCRILEVDDAKLQAFLAHCENRLAAGDVNFEYKARLQHGTTSVAMYVAHIGSLVVHLWHGVGRGVSFVPWRDAIFLESIFDQVTPVYLPYAVWHPAYCADTLGSAGAGVASVPCFAAGGRHYVNTSGMAMGRYSECHAWSFRPLPDWHGPTYNYPTQCRAWNDGRKQRADQRGLVVQVRGQLCVLDAYATFYDDQVPLFSSTLALDDEEVPDDEDELLAAEDDALVSDD
jgi:hypothetical protein